jgi:SWI/SNF-related matrix-associated actin-dependent regulator of chromatin subfamily A member 5
VGNC